MPWSCCKNSKLSHNLSSQLNGFLFERLFHFFPFKLSIPLWKGLVSQTIICTRHPLLPLYQKSEPQTRVELNSAVGEVTGNLSCLPAQKFDDHSAYALNRFSFQPKTAHECSSAIPERAPGGPLLALLCVYFIQSHKSRARPEIFIARGHSCSAETAEPRVTY
jgi:hypothetical protein